MFSARALVRCAPRALHRIAARPATIARPGNLLRAQFTPARSQISAFSTSLMRKQETPEVDAELSAKLGVEMEYENDAKEHDPQPVSVQDYLENSPFELKDVPGKQDVVLTRQMGKEKITVTFSISDLSEPEANSYSEDEAMSDEDGELMNEMTPREQQEVTGEEGEDPEGSGGEPGVSCRLNIVVEKKGQGALNISASVQDSAIIVENMYYYHDAAMAYGASPEAVHKERDVYPGPVFGTLDEDLQLLMEQYLEQRGIDQQLALFVPDYMEIKEHKEYVQWLKNVKRFIDA